jgi:hypothetical protein
MTLATPTPAPGRKQAEDAHTRARKQQCQSQYDGGRYRQDALGSDLAVNRVPGGAPYGRKQQPRDQRQRQRHLDEIGEVVAVDQSAGGRMEIGPALINEQSLVARQQIEQAIQTLGYAQKQQYGRKGVEGTVGSSTATGEGKKGRQRGQQQQTRGDIDQGGLGAYACCYTCGELHQYKRWQQQYQVGCGCALCCLNRCCVSVAARVETTRQRVENIEKPGSADHKGTGYRPHCTQGYEGQREQYACADRRCESINHGLVAFPVRMAHGGCRSTFIIRSDGVKKEEQAHVS